MRALALLPLLVVAGCHACRKEVVVPPQTAHAAVADAAVDAGQSRSVVPAFDRVLALENRFAVGAHPAGERALVSSGRVFVGYAEAGKPFVADASLGAGLPTGEGYDSPTLVGGRWPELLLVHGHWGGSGGDPAYALYATHGKAWSRVGHAVYDRPEAVMKSGAGFAIYEAESFHRENGLLPMIAGKPLYPCTDAPPQAIAGGVAGGTKITAPASFFEVALGSDGDGKPVGWGFVACKPGAFAFSVVRGRAVMEPLPGTTTCDARDEGTGLPLVSVQLFPAASGGLFALVGPGQIPAPACPQEWRRLERGPEGWRDLGPLPQRDAQTRLAILDPAGNAYLTTPRETVLRVDLDGKVTELGLAPSCLATPPVTAGENPPEDPEITAISAPFADDVWVTVKRGPDATTLCRHIRMP